MPPVATTMLLLLCETLAFRAKNSPAEVAANNNNENVLQSSMESPQRMLLAKIASLRGVSIAACDTNCNKEPFGRGPNGNSKKADSSGVKKAPGTCYYCGKQGHIAASCPKKAIKDRKSPNSSRKGERKTNNSFDSKINTDSCSRNTIEINIMATTGDRDNELHELPSIGLETVEDAILNPPRVSINRNGVLKSGGVENSVQITLCSDPVVTPSSNDFMKQQKLPPIEKVCNNTNSLEIPSLISGGNAPDALSSGSELQVLKSRNALLAAIRSRGRPDDLSSRASDADRLKKRNDLLAAIKSRRVGEDSAEDSISVNSTLTPRAADGERRALLPQTSVCQKENTLVFTMGNENDDSEPSNVRAPTVFLIERIR